MRTRYLARAAFVLATMLLASAASACDTKTGQRQQHVYADWNYRPIDSWVANSSETRKLKLPNGFNVGVRIEPQTQKDGSALTESVKISLFNLDASDAAPLTSTFGGANSIQGYGAQGGADRVVELGDPGLRLLLLKPACESGSAG